MVSDQTSELPDTVRNVVFATVSIGLSSLFWAYQLKTTGIFLWYGIGLLVVAALAIFVGRWAWAVVALLFLGFSLNYLLLFFDSYALSNLFMAPLLGVIGSGYDSGFMTRRLFT